jgi:hypothetical protein
MAKQKREGSVVPVIEQIATADLIPYARNSRTHSDEQVAQIAASIREFGFNNPVLVDAENTIIAGHGRVLAAGRIKLETVPCLRLTHLTDTQRRAYVIADNKIALNAGWDEELLSVELADLNIDKFDMSLLGFDVDDLSTLMGFNDQSIDTSNEESDVEYTNKITAPIYEPKGERPPITELIDREKTRSLIAEIDKSELPDDVREFMRFAAERHTVFNFRQIAEYYCHANPTLQNLMERSGMVIIDFDKAIEYGFVHLTERLGALADLSPHTHKQGDADNDDA